MSILLRILSAIFGSVFPRKDADVYAILDERAKDRPALDWRNSIADLLKLLDLDSSMAARKELAEEVGVEGYIGTAEQNVQLHRATMDKVRHRELG
jgi:Pyruvate/2-oxoacid:ferredoxin oxidoreductase gamma subunit